MSQVGEKYYFVSESSSKNNDRVRTLIGAFIGTLDRGARPVALKRGRWVGSASENNKLRRRIANYYNRRDRAWKRLRREASPEGRQAMMVKYANLERTRPEQKPYVLPYKSVIPYPEFSYWQQGSDAKLEAIRFIYHPELISNIVDTARRVSDYKNRRGRVSSRDKKGIARHRSRMRQMWDTWSMNVPRIVNKSLQDEQIHGTFWEDFSFPFERPIRASVANKMNVGSSYVRVATSELHTQYGYFLENFEKLAFNQVVQETELPNVYLVNMIDIITERLKDENRKKIAIDYDAYCAVSLYRKIPHQSISFRVARNDENAIKQPRKRGKVRKRRGDANSNSAYMNYLEHWSRSYNLSEADELSEIRLKNKNILFAASSFDQMQEINAKNKNIPMNTYFRFSAPTVRKNASIVELLRKGNFMTAFMLKAVEGHRDPDQIRRGPRSLWGASLQTEWVTNAEAEEREASGIALATGYRSRRNFRRVIDEEATKEAGQEQYKTTFERMDRAWKTISYYPQSYSLGPDKKVTVTTAQEPKQVPTKAFDMLKFLDRLSNGGTHIALDETTEDESILIHTGDEVDLNHSPTSAVRLNALILAGQLRKLVEEKHRSYYDICQGKACETEIVFFEVEKTKMSSNGALEVVQRFFIPNFVGRDAIEFIDSQVKYDGLYQYNVHAWTAVYGNRYKYLNKSHWRGKVPNPDNAWATKWVGFSQPVMNWKDKKMLKEDFKPNQEASGVRFGVQNVPSLRLMRLPYYECSPVRVRDFPPVAPHADIVPYRGVSDKLIINLMPGVDDHHGNPVSVTPSDHTRIEKYFESQHTREGMEEYNRTLENDDLENTTLIRYKSDDYPRYFEVVRIENPPTGWEDFEGGLRKVLNVDEGQTSMVDPVFANTDYYYTFRSLDIHGNISNPSPILKVTLHDDQGVFPVIEPYDFDRRAATNEEFKKPFRRYMQITQVFEQLVYKDERQSTEKTSIANRRKISLGVAKDSIYGKTLKIRVSSKKSGKKIDLNVSFSHEHTKPPS